MTTRYFYTDPLAAAWMAKHFGMDFVYPEEDAKRGVVWSYRLNGFVDFRDSSKMSFDLHHGHAQVRFYVHPDSLHLLDPQVRDMVTNLGLKAWNVHHIDGDTLHHIDAYTKKQDAIIIERNGVAFMWPESEPA